MLEELDADFDPWFEIAERVKAERKRAGLSRQQLALEVGVSRGTIFNWESGRRIPVEKCAALARGLGLETDDILAIHPEVPTLERPAVDLPDEPETVRFTRREVVLFSLVGVALVVGMGFLTWSTANANCTEVGAGDASVAPEFRRAFEDGGGRVALGCAVEDVRRWGPGVSQSIEGGDLGDGVILSYDGSDRAHVLAGELWQSFRWIADGAATDVAGHPVSDPLDCAGTLVVALEGGAAGPGALVQNAGGGSYEFVAGDVWHAYREAGGPAGPLGRPTSLTQTSDGVRGEFEHGIIDAPHGRAPSVDGPTGSPLALDSCSVVPVRVAAGI